jgi:hypothetical protein
MARGFKPNFSPISLEPLTNEAPSTIPDTGMMHMIDSFNF